MGGWNPDANPWELPANQAPILDNFLIRPDKISMRGPFKPFTDTGISIFCLGGAFSFADGSWVATQKTISNAACVDPWNAPIVRPTSAGSLAVPTTNYKLAPGVATILGGAVQNCPGPRQIIWDGVRYGLSYGGIAVGGIGPTVASTGGWFMTTTALLTGNLASAALLNPNGQAPCGAVDLKVHLSRLWLLGGVDTPGGATTGDALTLYFTNPTVGGTGGTTTAQWQDPVSGLTNKIRLDGNSFDPGVGLAVTHNALVVLRWNSIWIMRGTTTANFTIQPITKSVGCIDARSIVESDQGVYFLSQQGLMLTDGIVIKNVSGNVKETLISAINQYIMSVTQQAGGYATCVHTSDGNYLISIGLTARNDGRNYPLFCALFSPTTNSWTRITSSIWTPDSTYHVGNQYPGPLLTELSAGRIYAFGDRYMTRLEDVSGAGESFTQPAISQQTALYDQTPVAGDPSPYKPIPAAWQTRDVIIGITTLQRKFGQAKRFFLDYVFQAPSGGAWTATPINMSDVAYDSAMNATTGAMPSPGSVPNGALQAMPRLQRQNQDFVTEIGDLMFKIAWSPGNSASSVTNAIADIHGIGIEYQPTRDAR